MTDLNALRRRILETAFHANEGHIPSALSILEIVWTLYDKVLGVTPENWREPGANQFVLSKAHGCLALYAVLEAKGFITQDDMDRFCQPGGILGGHPGPDVPGVWAACGSLGHGLGMAVGMAYAKKLRKEAGRVHCLVGDGECQEGSCHEAWALARAVDEVPQRLPLTVLIDGNGSHSGWNEALPLVYSEPYWGSEEKGAMPLAETLLRYDDLYDAYVLHIHTTKGAGIPEMERDPAAWHRRVPTPQQYREMMEGLGE